ncbi:MAG: hypothetical protein NZM15_01385 [Flavobacteriales bacterium]|nr:hypothetical protein [Flavobacteriales bacterium]MDW8431336.1 hypothetical protein [Flavobacteriales bacterium]
MLILLCFSFLRGVGQVVFARTFGGPLEDGGFGLAATPNGHYVAAGYTGSFGAGAADGFLVCVNPLGFWQWQKTYGGPDTDVLRDIVWYGNYGYATGYTKKIPSGRYEGWLLCLDASGDTLFTRTFQGLGWCLPQAVAAADSSLYLCGMAYDSLGVAQGWAMRTDLQGAIQWQVHWLPPGQEEAGFEAVVVFSDSLMALGGHSVLGSDGQAALLFLNRWDGSLKGFQLLGQANFQEKITGIDYDGQKIWFCGSVRDPLNDRLAPLIGYIVPGTSTTYVPAPYFPLQFDNTYHKIKCFGQDDYYLTGKTTFLGQGFTAATAFRYDNDQLTWGTNVGNQGQSAAYGLLKTPDGGLLATGELTGQGPGLRALLMWKIDSLGNSVPVAQVNSESPPDPSSFRISVLGEELRLFLDPSPERPANLEIWSLEGKLLYSKDDLQASAAGYLTVPLAGMPRMGLVRLRIKDAVWCLKFVRP